MSQQLEDLLKTFDSMSNEERVELIKGIRSSRAEPGNSYSVKKKVEKAEKAVKDPLRAALKKLTPEQLAQLQQQLKGK